MHCLSCLAQKLEACGVKRGNVIENLAVRLRIDPQAGLSFFAPLLRIFLPLRCCGGAFRNDIDGALKSRPGIWQKIIILSFFHTRS
jgi:hypothetical protein